MNEVKGQIPRAKLPKPLQRIKLVVLAAYYGLFLYFLLSSILVYDRLSLISIIVWIIQITPLLIFLPGLHRTHLRTYAWLSFVILLYFIHAVLVAFEPASLWLGVTEVTLCIIAFGFLMLFIRQYRQHYQVNL